MMRLSHTTIRHHLIPLGAAAVGTLALLLNACGGSSSSSRGPATDVGQFKDSNVEGLGYQSGHQSGHTNAAGEFTHTRGEPVTFSIGGVVLGTVAEGKPVVTPLDLVAGNPDTSHPAVQNMVRFLTLLDANNNPDDGITIDAAIQTLATSWEPLDFTSAHFDSDVADIVAQVNDVLPHGASLPSASDAQAHLERTLRCVYGGAFQGTYRQHDNGTARGQFSLLVSATDGTVRGWIVSHWDEHGAPDDIDVITLEGDQPLDYSSSMAFVSGFGSDGSNFEGSFQSPDHLSGSYTFDYLAGANGGTFTGSRFGGASNALWRFTGLYQGATGRGVMAFDINSSGTLLGLAYDIVEDDITRLGGSLDLTDGSLSVTAQEQPIGTGTVDLATGTLTGNWAFNSDSGTFTGDGCRLN